MPRRASLRSSTSRYNTRYNYYGPIKALFGDELVTVKGVSDKGSAQLICQVGDKFSLLGGAIVLVVAILHQQRAQKSGLPKIFFSQTKVY